MNADALTRGTRHATQTNWIENATPYARTIMGTETHNSDNFRAIGALPISATAKYIASVIVALGTQDASEIIAITGLPRSTVYRAMAEFFTSGGDSLICLTRPTSEIPTRPTDGNCSEKPVSLVPPVRQTMPEISRVRPDIDSRATKELPSEVLCYEDIITPSSVPPKRKDLPSAQRRACKPKGSRLKPDWELPDDWRQWARMNFAHASDAMVTDEAEKFRDYWIAKTGNAATKLDWQATWRNWCRNSKTIGIVNRPQQPINSGRMAWDEQKAAKRAEFLRLARGEANVQ